MYLITNGSAYKSKHRRRFSPPASLQQSAQKPPAKLHENESAANFFATRLLMAGNESFQDTFSAHISQSNENRPDLGAVSVNVRLKVFDHFVETEIASISKNVTS